MQKTYMAVRLPISDQNSTIEIPRSQIFDNFDDAFICFLALIKDEEPFFEKEQPRREQPVEYYTDHHLYQIWITNIPEVRTHVSWGI